MTRDEIIQRIWEISSKSTGDERAHILDDELRNDFIEFVAQRDDELGELAKLILTTNDIPFSRWYS